MYVVASSLCVVVFSLRFIYVIRPLCFLHAMIYVALMRVFIYLLMYMLLCFSYPILYSFVFGMCVHALFVYFLLLYVRSSVVCLS